MDYSFRLAARVVTHQLNIMRTATPLNWHCNHRLMKETFRFQDGRPFLSLCLDLHLHGFLHSLRQLYVSCNTQRSPWYGDEANSLFIPMYLMTYLTHAYIHTPRSNGYIDIKIHVKWGKKNIVYWQKLAICNFTMNSKYENTTYWLLINFTMNSRYENTTYRFIISQWTLDMKTQLTDL